MIARLMFALWIVPAISLVWAHDGSNDKWYESLKRPGTERTCCTGHDCKPTEAEIRDGRWWVRDPEDGTWIEVPDDAVIRDQGNPVGQPVVCLIHIGDEYTGEIVYREVRCFVPGGLS